MTYKYLMLSLVLTNFSAIFAQPSIISLETCQQQAQANYPLIQQQQLIELETLYNKQNITSLYRPQLSVNAQASYQTDVTTLPLKMPGINIQSMDKDQYKLTIDAQQLIWDGGQIRVSQEINQQSEQLKSAEIKVQTYPVRDRVNNLFFGYLTAKSQLELNKIWIKDLQASQDLLHALTKNGMANQSDENLIQAEIIQIEQQQDTWQSNMQACIDMLNLLCKMNIQTSDSLLLPDKTIGESRLLRPELDYFTAQKQLLTRQIDLVKAKNKPRLTLFAQGGYGKPGLNMLSNDFALFGIGGVRLSWNLGTLYNKKREVQLLQINQKKVEVQEQLFELNIQIELAKYMAAINLYKKNILKDELLIKRRSAIRLTSESKYKNGIYTINDLIKDINAENRAKQQLKLHVIQLQMSIALYQSVYNTTE